MADMKNLEDVLSGLLSATQAREAAEDIRSGDCLLQEHPAPRPDAELLADINARVAAALVARRPRVGHWIGRAVAAAAAVIIAGGMLLFFSGDSHRNTAPTRLPMLAAPGWWDDSAVETLTAEVDDVFETMISISIDDTFVEDQMSDFDEAELEELEAIATNDDFWKG